MMFSVIYSADTLRGVPVDAVAPPFPDLWKRTEENETGYDAFSERNSRTGVLEKGHHWKWCALLTREQFDAFVKHYGLHASDVETMGSLGAPGFGNNWAPAISFESWDFDHSILSAYVTPIPTMLNEKGGIATEHDWQRIRRAMLKIYKS